MKCLKNPVPKQKIKQTLREAEQHHGVQMFAYDCPRCGNIHLTTEVPGSKPGKRII